MDTWGIFITKWKLFRSEHCGLETKFDHFLFLILQLQLKLATVISNLYVSLESPEDASLERVQPLDFVKEECEDAVWIQIHSVSNTPALNQKWKETVTRHRLLDYLKVDPNNVVSWFFFFQSYQPSLVEGAIREFRGFEVNIVSRSSDQEIINLSNYPFR